MVNVRQTGTIKKYFLVLIFTSDTSGGKADNVTNTDMVNLTIKTNESCDEC